MKIIPAIDLMNGQCVRLTEGDFSTRKTYYEDPLEAALAFETAGLTHLHLVDLDGARSGAVKHWDVLERLVGETSLVIDFSGGIKTAAEVDKAFGLGASQVALGSLSVRQPDLVKDWLGSYGPESIIIGADIKDGTVAIHGWQESSNLTAHDFFHAYIVAGATDFLCTDVSRDGLLQGPSVGLYTELLDEFPEIRLIASGGVASMDDLVELRSIGCTAAIVGKAIYEGRVTPAELAIFQRAGDDTATSPSNGSPC